ncbi:uncharacterized protein ACNLHF_023771 [Anomaloglossus baeobatrachus]|uniref:uncharacterized protein LOC142243663 n=1 Tax=Anomaloglossus baeobatrachus TaxID=238106 RepID=UPI003F4F6C5B
MERPLISESLAQVTFDDAAVYFSEEQWDNLEEFQKKIYKELIKEIYETMLALGYRIPKPDIVSRIERGEEPCVDASKKSKRQEPQPQGTPDGSKDSERAIKVERESPEASTPMAPSEISSSQERGGAQCTRCGMFCNNQCRMGFQWNASGMYPGSPMDVNHGKPPYMTPQSSYFNGSPISPGYASRGEGMSHPTSPMAAYGNPGMVSLSPHYPAPSYRNATDPSSPFSVPERPGNPVFAYEQMPMGPPSSHVDLENRNRNNYAHMRDAMFHERRNPLPPCPGCGTYCNNQCGINIHWEQRRLHHPMPGPVDAAQGHRYTSPPNPYYSGGVNTAPFSNIRPSVRHGAPPVNVQGNPGMMQVSAPYPGYRRPGDVKSPNVFPNKPEVPMGNGIHGNNQTVSSPHGANQGVKYGMVPPNSSGSHRKSQSMSPLAAIETMPVFAAINNPGAIGDQRNRPLPQTVTSSDNSRDRNLMPSYNNVQQQQQQPPSYNNGQQQQPPSYNNGQQQQPPSYNNGQQQQQQQPSYNNGQQQQQLNYSIHGSRITRVPVTSATGQPKPGEAALNKNPSLLEGVDKASKNALPSSSTFLAQDVERFVVNESHATKRPATQMASESGLPVKRASPPVIILDEEKRTPTPRSAGTNKGSAKPSPPVVIIGCLEPKKTLTPEIRENRRQTPPITISNVRGGAGRTEKKCPTPPITISNVRGANTPEVRPPTPPITISNVRSTGTLEVKEKCQSPPITISNIRSAGIFFPPTASGQSEAKKDSNTIIIIDDKDGEGMVAPRPPRTSPISGPTIELKTSAPVTPHATNPISNREPPPAPLPSSTSKTNQAQGGQQGAAVLVSKVQVQQPSPIIVTGGTNLSNQPLSVPVNGNQSIMLTFPVSVGSSGIVLATPVKIAENQISGIKQNNRVAINKNTRLVPTSTMNPPRAVNPKFSSVAVSPVIGQTNTISVPPGHTKPVAINVNQTGNITSALSVKNSNLPKVGGTALKAVPVSTTGNPQAIPLFVDANSGLILTGSAVPSKDNVSSGLGNATVVTVNGNVVGGKLAFSNLAPVNGLYIGNNSPVALAGNPNNFNNKGTLSINNPTILTLNGGLGIGNSGSVAAPITNISSVNANRTLQVATKTSASTVIGGASQPNNTVFVRKIGEQSGVSTQPNSEQQPTVVLERLFKCSKCDQKFNSLENLTSHQAVHKPVEVPAGGRVSEPASKNSKEVLPGTGGDDAPTILYTTQGDDGSTVYVVTV